MPKYVFNVECWFEVWQQRNIDLGINNPNYL